MPNEQYVDRIHFRHPSGCERIWEIFCTFSDDSRPAMVRVVWGCVEKSYPYKEPGDDPFLQAVDRVTTSRLADIEDGLVIEE